MEALRDLLLAEPRHEEELERLEVPLSSQLFIVVVRGLLDGDVREVDI